MRILIVDDNVALQEILAEVISNAGHEAEVTASTKTAVSVIDSFKPELIILDSDMENGNGLTLVDIMQDSDPPIETSVIVLKSWNRQIPQDSSVIKGYVQKPFTTYDLLKAIVSATAEDEPEEKVNKESEETVFQADTTISDKGISFGGSYVMFQSNSSQLYDLVNTFDKNGYEVLLVTPGKNKAIRERFKNNQITTHNMSLKLIGGYFNIYKLGTMIDDVRSFIEGKELPVVAFDDLGKLIERNGMNSVLTSIHQILVEEYSRKVSFLVSVDPKGFTKKDKEILLNHMSIYEPTGE